MFEYVFPIFAFGVVITAVVAKGVLTAAEVAKAERLAHAQLHPEKIAPAPPPKFSNAAQEAA